MLKGGLRLSGAVDQDSSFKICRKHKEWENDNTDREYEVNNGIVVAVISDNGVYVSSQHGDSKKQIQRQRIEIVAIEKSNVEGRVEKIPSNRKKALTTELGCTCIR